MSRVSNEGGVGGSVGDHAKIRREGEFVDRSVAVSSPNEPAAKQNQGEGVFHSIGIFLREVCENMGLLRLEFPDVEHIEGDEAKLKAIGHYMMRCSSLQVRPRFPDMTTLENIDLDTMSTDPEVQIAALAIDYFRDGDDDKNERLIRQPGGFFIDIAKAYLKDNEHLIEGNVRNSLCEGIDGYVLSCINEKDPKAKLIGTQYLKRVGETTGLSPADVIAMRLLGRGLENPNKLSFQEKLFVAEFLNKVPGNMKLNKALRELKPDDLERNGVDKDVASKLGRLSFKTRERKVYDNAYQKLKNLEYHARKGNVPPDKYRLSLHEAIVLEEFGQVADIMDEFANVVKDGAAGFGYEGMPNAANTTLSHSNKLKAGKMMSDNLKVKLAESLNLQSGDIIQNIGKKFLSMQGSQASRAEQIRYLASIYRHSGKVCMVDGKLSVSDVWAKYRNYEMGFTDLITSDFFRIDATKLIKDPEMIQALKDKYGEGWEEKVNRTYRVIEQELHALEPEKKYSKIRNTRNLQAKIGLTYLFKGLHKRSSDRTYEGLHSKVMEGQYGEKHTPMVCSVFAAKTTLAALYQLNEDLKADLGVDKDVIAMPFGPREKMHNINPDRFTEILEEAGCIDRIQGRETFEQYFDLDPVHGVGDVHTV
ncbi:MAG: hypothetical protein Tsb0018_03600 [Opitutales bacterium]